MSLDNAKPEVFATADAWYQHGRAKHGSRVAFLESRSRLLSRVRLGVAVASLALFGGVLWGRLGPLAWGGLGALVVGFVVLVFLHAGVLDAKERACSAMRFHERGLARLALAWDRLPTASERFRSADHPFTGDLDIFGRASLMQIVDATETNFGEERLARLLSLEVPGAWPDDVIARQEAVRDLASRLDFREALAAAGGVLADERPDAKPLLAWAEASGRWAEPEGRRARPSAAWVWMAWVLPAIVVVFFAVGSALHVRPGVVTAVGFAQIALGIFVGLRLAPMLEAVSARESAATRWRTMIAAIEREPFQAPLLVSLREGLKAGGTAASGEIAAFGRIVGFTDARRNEVFRFLIGPLLMWDAHCAFALLRWRVRAGSRLRGWLDALGEVEALASLAGFAFEHPEFAWPEASAEPVVDARSLGHPLILADKRVGNDVHLPSAGRALVVTGSNMSGKSTLLRAIGVNAVLACAGAPVCARAMRMGPARVVTSMRIEDSLEQGVSHFYAELRRLKRVIDLAHSPQGPAVLFLLDEILHGTNSRERIIGACAVVRQLLARGALGAVSTHDLGITALERELAGRVENVHFEEQVQGSVMAFDYVLRPGVVHSSNALRLMRAVGIDVEEA
jgi:hypothetical protein